MSQSDQRADPGAGSLLTGYAPLPGRYDELMDEAGAVRPHWRPFIDGLQAMGPAEVGRRWRKAEHILRENGLTYDLPESGEAVERASGLDPLPLILPATEWRQLAAGLKQRARLLNRVLADLYGPRRLIRGGCLPAAAVVGEPGFLRPAVGIEPRGGVHLQFLSLTLGRGPDGAWRVLSSDTEAPGDSGYAVENRIVLSRVFPDLFRASRVERLAGYFRDLHESLLARAGRDNPRLVLLTAGPGEPGYFADAYLARYLGYTLAESWDLTVRGSEVFLKTIDGLRRVDLILRQVPAGRMDPLELDGESAFGVPGLLHALREDGVTLANPLSASLAQSPALDAFLPVLCEELLGEPLALPSVPTFWCGEAAARAEVMGRFDDLTFYGVDAWQADGPRALHPKSLSDGDRTALREAVETKGERFTARAPFELSGAPTWQQGQLQAAPVALQVFLSAAGDDYEVMPGGLARLADMPEALHDPVADGATSKDSWVLADGPVSTFSLLKRNESQVELRRIGKDLPSRAADNLYWLGRYGERAEALMRVLAVSYRRANDDAALFAGDAPLAAVLHTFLSRGRSQKEIAAIEGMPTTERMIRLLSDRAEPYGLVETLGHLVRTAWLTRDRLSIDAWNTLNRFNGDANWRALRFGYAGDQARETMDEMFLLEDGLRLLAAFSGLAAENMTRSHGWRFLDLGRRIERAKATIDLLKGLMLSGEAVESGALLLLLEIADSVITYRSRYRITPLRAPVLDLLVYDETNPRSLAFQFVALSDLIGALPQESDVTTRMPSERIVLDVLTHLRLSDTEVLADGAGGDAALSALLKRVDRALPNLSDEIARAYFSHASSRRAEDWTGGAEREA